VWGKHGGGHCLAVMEPNCVDKGDCLCVEGCDTCIRVCCVCEHAVVGLLALHLMWCFSNHGYRWLCAVPVLV
jgi:hypothetical protein